MNNNEQIVKIKEELNRINFGEGGIIQLEQKEIEEYTFKDLDKEIGHKVNKVCLKCKDYNKPNEFKNYTKHCLCNIMHGAHTIDFLSANGLGIDGIKKKLCEEKWNSQPVLFLLENPSNDYGIYHDTRDGWEGKRPSKKWYWIIDDYENSEDSYLYPTQLKQGYYGTMFYSLIRMFKLGNAYATDIIKCGMNSDDGNEYLDSSFYQANCISMCVKTHLAREINALTSYNKEIIVFAFGQRTYDLVKDVFSQKEQLGICCEVNPHICLMPHPANRLANDYRKYVLFGKAYKTLCKFDIDCSAALDEFLDDNEEQNHGSLIIKDEEKLNGQIEDIGKRNNIKVCRWEPKKNYYNANTLKYWLTEEKTMFSDNTFYSEIGFYLQLSNSDSKISFGYNVNGFWIWDPQKKKFIDDNKISQYNDERSKVYSACVETINALISSQFDK